jgi:hypothetical protein
VIVVVPDAPVLSQERCMVRLLASAATEQQCSYMDTREHFI